MGEGCEPSSFTFQCARCSLETMAGGKSLGKTSIPNPYDAMMQLEMDDNITCSVWYYAVCHWPKDGHYDCIKPFIQAWFYTVCDEILWSHPNSVPSSVFSPPKRAELHIRQHLGCMHTNIQYSLHTRCRQTNIPEV